MNDRALVLGGGGSAGNAWEIGVIAGLFNTGLDVAQADVIIGTSAGATVAVQISGETQPMDLLADIISTALQPTRAQVGQVGNPARIVPTANHMEVSSAAINAARDPAEMRRNMGAAALETDPEPHSFAQKQWRATVAGSMAVIDEMKMPI